MSIDYMESIANDVGKQVTVKKVAGSVNKWGDKDISYDDTIDTNVVVEEIETDTSEESEGDVQTADFRLFFQSGTDYVSRGNVVEIDGTEYEINEVNSQSSMGEETHIEARVKTV